MLKMRLCGVGLVVALVVLFASQVEGSNMLVQMQSIATGNTSIDFQYIYPSYSTDRDFGLGSGFYHFEALFAVNNRQAWVIGIPLAIGPMTNNTISIFKPFIGFQRSFGNQANLLYAVTLGVFLPAPLHVTSGLAKLASISNMYRIQEYLHSEETGAISCNFSTHKLSHRHSPLFWGIEINPRIMVFETEGISDWLLHYGTTLGVETARFRFGAELLGEYLFSKTELHGVAIGHFQQLALAVTYKSKIITPQLSYMIPVTGGQQEIINSMIGLRLFFNLSSKGPGGQWGN